MFIPERLVVFKIEWTFARDSDAHVCTLILRESRERGDSYYKILGPHDPVPRLGDTYNVLLTPSW